ncbi:MAG: B12-binding domain-containing radical SAM protein [Candidatus Brocadiales bacterium]|nr:B12-binding domain-containing radical SAM protein [Candidatus Brocadiales bacterium]
MKKKTILLLRPPYEFTPSNETSSLHIPLGLLYIASPLLSSGYDVKIIDGILPDGDIDTWQEESGDFYFGVHWEGIERKIKIQDFDIAGISAQFSVQFRNTKILAELIKKIKPDCKVVVGGAHATVRHKQILEEIPEIDAVISGEGEISFSELVNRFYSNEKLDNISGLTWRDEDKIVENAGPNPITDIDSITLPAYDLIDIERYLEVMERFSTRTYYGGRPGITVITSRGCPFQCTFCSVHLHMGRRWRGHSPEYVINHLELLVKKYNIKYFHFEDDDLTANPARFERILDKIIEKKMDIWWDTPNGVRADSFTQEIMGKCKISGCKFLIFGVESGSQRVLNNVIRKSLKLKDVEKACYSAKRSGVITRAFFIMGLPGERKIDILKTSYFMIKLALKYNTFGGTGFAIPLFGTELYKVSIEKKYLKDDLTYENFEIVYTKKGMLRTEDFSPDFVLRVIGITEKLLYYLEIVIFFKRIVNSPLLIKYVLMELKKGFSIKEMKRIFNEIVFWLPEENMAGYKNRERLSR